MKVVILDDEGRPLDAHGESRDFGLILDSRGGARGAPNVRNTDYAAALRLILGRLAKAGLAINGIWVDSARVQHLSLAERLVLRPEELMQDPEAAFSLLSKRMGLVGSARARSGGNRNKRLRIEISGQGDAGRLAEAVGARPVEAPAHARGRLSAAVLEQVGADHIWLAIRDLRAGARHPFGEATTYDLITDDGDRLPPKAVFGLAATRALGFEVRPEHFSAGYSQSCFRILRRAGYRIEAKSLVGQQHQSPEDRTWREGQEQMVRHVRRERGSGLGAAKKADFRRRHGRLFCERCRLDPVEAFGSVDGEACIEVHHALVRVSEMTDGHETRLEDLQCLCANCHRYIHRALEFGET